MAQFMQTLLMVSVMFLVLGVGLRTTIGQIVAVARQFLLLRGMLANFLIVPLAFYLGMLWLPLSLDVKIGIMIMAAAPIAPMAPPFVGMAKADLAYSVGLMAIVALLSVPLTPLILSLALPEGTGGLTVDPWSIVKILLTAQLIPLCGGIAIRRVRPAWADQLLKFVPRIGQIGLLISVGFILWEQVEQISAIRAFEHSIILAMVVASLLIGDLTLIGETVGRRRSLAIVTAIRNVPLAFLIANTSFPGTTVASVVLIFSVFSMLLSVIYGKLTIGRRGKEAGS
ncbi:MAG: hypothetical protein O7I42_04105 [Alphaproteobacteria bacterium]|nr:hypothetical protein [Alphaproteobacteria bacterium]